MTDTKFVTGATHFIENSIELTNKNWTANRINNVIICALSRGKMCFQSKYK